MNPRASTTRLVLAIGTLLAASLAGCTADEAPREPTATSESAIMSADQRNCPAELGTCYEDCQQVTPTPTDGCFTGCRTDFDTCLADPSAPAPAKPIYN